MYTLPVGGGQTWLLVSAVSAELVVVERVKNAHTLPLHYVPSATSVENKNNIFCFPASLCLLRSDACQRVAQKEFLPSSPVKRLTDGFFLCLFLKHP